MRCEDVRKYGYAYLDGEFDDRDATELEAHVAACEPCRAELEGMQSFRHHVRSQLERPACPLAARNQVLAELARCDQPAAWQRTLGWSMALAACGALVWTGVRYVADAGPQGVGQATLAADARTAAGLAPPRQGDTPQPLKIAVNNATDEATDKPADGPTGKAIAKAPAARPRVAAEERPAPRADAPAAVVGRTQRAPRNSANPYKLASHTRRQPSATAQGEVLGGSVTANALVERSPFGALRSAAGLRAVVRAHVRKLPPEVRSGAKAVQKHVSEHLPGAGALPIAEGGGVVLRGARLSQHLGRPVVVYDYRAYGVPVTAVVHLRADNDGPFDEPDVEDVSPGDARGVTEGVLLDRLAGFHIIHRVEAERVVTLVSELGLPALRPLVAD